MLLLFRFKLTVEAKLFFVDGATCALRPELLFPAHPLFALFLKKLSLPKRL